jgi:hypothetical protein
MGIWYGSDGSLRPDLLQEVTSSSIKSFSSFISFNFCSMLVFLLIHYLL